MDAERFGETAEGEAVHRARLSGGGLTAHVLTYGGVLQDLRLEGHDAPLVLGFDMFEPYLTKSPYFGAIPGRCANRIGNARFTIDGKRYCTDPNFLGKHTLHGGSKGTGKRLWQIGDQGGDFVTLHLTDPDGWMGFPGNLEVSCTYRLKPAGTLELEYEATTDQPTLCNFAHHSYFNLDDGGAGNILDHRLMINAAAYLPVDDELIPTGIVEPVDGTPFDFRQARPVRYKEEGEQFVYDHNFCLSAARGRLKQAAWAQGADSGVEMEVWTTEPGVQFYAGHKVSPGVPGHGRRIYGANAGFCLEAQVWPDAVNRPYFPSAILRPGEIYRQVTQYRFRLP
jgi:aldose 1-epimerase